MEILCFYAGIAFVYVNKFYSLLFIVIAFYFRQKMAFIIWFLTAIFWGLSHQWWVKPYGLPHDPVIQNAVLTGQIVSIPVVNGDSVQFSFLAHQLNGKSVYTTIAMACYNHCPPLHSGQYCQLTAKLKKPRNLGNPGGFDYVGWLSSKHIDWSGLVRRGSFKLVHLNKNSFSILQIREQLCEKLALLDPDEKTLGIIQALTLGVNSHINKAQWDLFRHTGTTHLIDISGSHIALLVALTFYVIRWLWTRMGTLCLYIPAQKAASIFALMIAYGYTLLSGFAVPAQRALIACFFMLLRHFMSQRFSVWQAWRYALLSVLVYEPHSVLSAGFYLSFIGVAILVLVNQRVSISGIQKTFVLQLACLVGMMPLTLFWFNYGAVNGILANLFTIPWVELWIVPLGLIITIIPINPIASVLTVILKGSISIFLAYLHWVDSYAMLNLTFSFNQVLSPVALMMTLCVMLFLPIRLMAFPICMLAFSAMNPQHLKLKPGTAQIDIMDVGQGLAVVVNTAHHLLIYDTGVKFYQGSDMAKLAIIPYLKTLGVKKIDKIVISHPDIDHRGGLNSLEETFSVKELIVDSPSFYHRGNSCHDYPEWSWDGVTFRFFAIKSLPNKKNNHSCVLKITTAMDQLLLTGDIEKQAEDNLVFTYGRALASTFIVIPHHASKTSSTSSFIEQVSPQYAIVSYGFDNRYHFPHQQALKTYQERHIPIVNTVDCGMVTVNLGTRRNIDRLKCYTHDQSK